MPKHAAVLTLALASLTVAPALGAGFESLTHHWNFDEGPDWHDDPFGAVCTATVARDSVGAAHATLQGMGADAWVSGRQYTALAFDGVDDSLSTASDLSGDLGGTATLSFWLKTTQTGAAAPDSAPGILGSTGVQWGWLDETGKIVLSVDGTPVVRSAAPVNDGTWHHLVFTRDASTGAAQVFLDGQPSASGTGPAGVRSGAISRIGQMQNGSPARFQGRLDQIHVFSGIIDSPTLQALYDNHAPKTWPVTTDGESSAPFSTASVLVNTYVYDAEQDTLSVASFTQPSHGSVAHNGDGTFAYTAASGFTGTDSFEVLVTDGRGGFAKNTVNVTVRPAASPDAGKRTTTFTNFQAIQAGGDDIALSGWRVPRAIDWDGDGDKDLLVGDDTGIRLYQNTGTATAPSFAAGVRVQAGGADIALSGSMLIALADMTGDGVDDLVVVDSSRKIHIHRNTSAAGQVPVYAAATIVPSAAGGDFVLPDQRFDAADWDGDGLTDIVMGSRSGELRAYRNVGTAAAPVFDPTVYQVLESDSYNLYPRVFDINRNGQHDYVRGINWGSIAYWFDPSSDATLGNNDGNLSVTYAAGTSVDMKALTDGAMVDFADFNGDGVYDILIGGHAGSKTYIAYGIANTVADSIADIEAIYDAHPTGLGAALEASNQALLDEIKSAESNIIMHMQAGTLSERQGYFAQMTTHVGKYAFLQMGSALDTNEYHHLPGIAGQNLMTMHEMLPDSAAHRTAVADAAGLTGLHREIYLQMGLHVGDNQKATRGQLESIRDFMRLQPRESFPDAAITLNHYYGDGRDGWVNSFRGAKNTFNFGEGNNASEWDADLQSAIRTFFGDEVDRGDYFTFVMGHEVTHSLDGYVSSRANKDLWRRKGQMITCAAGPDVLSAAGDDHDFWDRTVTKARFQAQGYWDGDDATWDQAWDDYWATGPGSVFNEVSMMRLNVKFFLGSPQEAMATQANHHWAHAEGRLIGALDRWKRGVEQGIDPMKANISEALAFLDWISCGMNKIVMQDTEGVATPYKHAEFHTTRAWVERDDKGRITKLTTGGRAYEFTVDDFGIVTGIVEAPAFQKDDEVSVVRDTPNLIRPLENDETTGGVLQIDSFTQPAHGTLADEGNGVLIYTPNAGYLGPDSFTYATSPGVPSSTVSILVENPANSQSGVLMETWWGIPGTAVNDLTSNADFPHNPDNTSVRSLFEAPVNRGSEFGTRMRALLVPPTSGDYTFWIASDDGGELWLADNRAGAGKALVASVSEWTASREWTKFSSQQSTTITLQAGKPYLIEALLKENSGSDNLAVAWQGPGISQTVITSSHLRTVDLHAPSVATPTPDVTVVENTASTTLDLSATFTDPDFEDSIVLELTGNTNPALVAATLTGTQLTLNYAADQSGTAEISVRAHDLGGATATETIAVTVQADNDGDGDPDLTDPDDDNDAIPDSWESAHGLDPFSDDSAADPDGDGLDNLAEYVTDTDPSDPDSLLSTFIELSPSTGARAIRFRTSPNRRYTVEASDDLSPGSWTPVGATVTGTGAEMTIDDTSGLPRRFYHIRVELP